ncbi:hypothetical protein HGRIS_011905 [Hohenbuehelia grisea]|uniref:Uncharacterized protein n=1 Tax=Hohenbuehelia grisea TaxID=104357 RepID=A0ABR3JXI1_9AGAR
MNNVPKMKDTYLAGVYHRDTRRRPSMLHTPSPPSPLRSSDSSLHAIARSHNCRTTTAVEYSPGHCWMHSRLMIELGKLMIRDEYWVGGYRAKHVDGLVLADNVNENTDAF